MGIIRLDRVRNVDVRNELVIEPLIDKIEQGQLRWFGHLIRMKDTVICAEGCSTLDGDKYDLSRFFSLVVI